MYKTRMNIWGTGFFMHIATWNINSVRLRIHYVLRFTKEQNIDVMCLQETKLTKKKIQK